MRQAEEVWQSIEVDDRNGSESSLENIHNFDQMIVEASAVRASSSTAFTFAVSFAAFAAAAAAAASTAFAFAAASAAFAAAAHSLHRPRPCPCSQKLLLKCDSIFSHCMLFRRKNHPNMQVEIFVTRSLEV